jgi:predicted nucleotidyltransferase
MKKEFLLELKDKLSEKFNDFNGMYFYGSRVKRTNKKNSDYDLALIFGSLNYEKELEIAGVVTSFEYYYNIFIDYKTLTLKGSKSFLNIKKNINPLFVKEIQDTGIFYERTR